MLELVICALAAKAASDAVEYRTKAWHWEQQDARTQDSVLRAQQRLQHRRRLARPDNCRNCGAPHEPVCSYCLTRA